MAPAISPTLLALVVLFGVLGLIQGLYVYLLRNRTGEERLLRAEHAYGDDRTEEVLSSGTHRTRDRDERPLHAEEDNRKGTVGSGEVRCPDCRTENEAGYDFCRECLSELPA